MTLKYRTSSQEDLCWESCAPGQLKESLHPECCGYSLSPAPGPSSPPWSCSLGLFPAAFTSAPAFFNNKWKVKYQYPKACGCSPIALPALWSPAVCLWADVTTHLQLQRAKGEHHPPLCPQLTKWPQTCPRVGTPFVLLCPRFSQTLCHWFIVIPVPEALPGHPAEEPQAAAQGPQVMLLNQTSDDHKEEGEEKLASELICVYLNSTPE